MVLTGADPLPPRSQSRELAIRRRADLNEWSRSWCVASLEAHTGMGVQCRLLRFLQVTVSLTTFPHLRYFQRNNILCVTTFTHCSLTSLGSLQRPSQKSPDPGMAAVGPRFWAEQLEV